MDLEDSGNIKINYISGLGYVKLNLDNGLVYKKVNKSVYSLSNSRYNMFIKREEHIDEF